MLVMLLAVMSVLAALTVLTTHLVQSTDQATRNEITRAALAQAKDALIARAATDENRPGSLPCPDRHDPMSAQVGQADSLGTHCANVSSLTEYKHFIGRLPWKTLRLEDLRDGYGERLWYALSPNFADRNDAKINSDTKGQLNLVSTSGTENEIIAIVFSAGPPVGDQSREDLLDQSQYLEQENSDTADLTFATRPHAINGPPFNDQVAIIRYRDLFPPVERTVGRRIAAILRDYSARWDVIGRPILPYAAVFSPLQEDILSVCGMVDHTRGALPVSYDGPCKLAWSGIGVKVNGDEIAANVCVADAPQENRMTALTCSIPYSGFGRIDIKADVLNIGKTLAVPIELSTIGTDPTPFPFPAPPIVGQTLSSSGHLNIHYRAYYLGMGTAVITLPIYSVLTRYAAAKSIDTSWITNNEWHRLVYYGVVEQRLPAGSSTCVPGDPDEGCLSIANGRKPNEDKEALLVLPGPPLPSKTRPSDDYGDYFEGQNFTSAQTAANLFEMQKTSASFNDTVSVVLPAP